jgi:hypothetical protein
MHLFIPPLGTKLRLVWDYTFLIESEYRNRSIYEALDLGECSYSPMRRVGWSREAGSVYEPIPPKPVSLVKDTILIVDRIFIRKGLGDFDSITFIVDDGPDKRLCTKKKGGTRSKAVRFWVKLDQVNGLRVDEVTRERRTPADELRSA